MDREKAWEYVKGYIQAITDHFGYVKAELLLAKMKELEGIVDEQQAN